jgi:hypothetical protein
MLNPLTKLLGVMKGIAAIGGIEAASEALGTVSQVKTVNRANLGRIPNRSARAVALTLVFRQ